ncbi:Ribonucleases P/MRP protein subunit POP1 like protein [Argiope bruennichi]|uniref:Ribonucleases P/MRP protein subunit POP1 like protein n=1 Tax=Argiope bruennichi TaxID=94029 RepID=A0A8T0EJN9_ARGBR|nr:Ribonucleases P/MRP protein subunit POP1 like protein [Argiope bruennichi]
MRRRGASQNPKRVPRKLRTPNQNLETKAKPKKKVHKKKPKDLQEEYASRSKPDSIWLENHIWFAKRFKMDILWGYHIPIHPNDKKIGSSHDSVANHAMLQDLSYYCCIELEGAETAFSNGLQKLVDCSSGNIFFSKMYLDGTREGHTMLHHPECCPFKAIGPVSFLWKPMSVLNDSLHARRKLWIWCHPSCHDELIDVFVKTFDLKNEERPDISESFSFACKLNFMKSKQHFCKEKIFSGPAMKMMLLKNTLVRHRLIGPMAQTVLFRVLKSADITNISNNNLLKNEISENGKNPKRLKLDDGQVNDSKPLWWELYYDSKSRKELHIEKEELLECLSDSQSGPYVIPKSIVGLTVRDPRTAPSWKKDDNELEEERFELYKDLGQSFTSEMADSALWDENIRNEVTTLKLSDKEINDARSNCIIATDLGKKENRIPILIIHQNGINGFAYGMGPNCSSRMDFPCTSTGAAYEEKLRMKNLKEHYKRPKSKRPNFSTLGITTPFFMCWKTLISEWINELKSDDIASLFPSVANLGVLEINEVAALNHPEFYVYRNPAIRRLNNLCRRLLRMPRTGFSDIQQNELLETFRTFVLSLNPKIQFCKSLILVKLRCLNKGRPSIHAGIYLLSEQDMKELKKDPAFCGPTEPNHPNKEKGKKSPKELDRPEIKSLISNSSRKMIGYVSEGGFSSFLGQGCAIGHCTSIGYLTMLKRCLDANLKPFVLIRDQHSFKYRISTAEIIECNL